MADGLAGGGMLGELARGAGIATPLRPCGGPALAASREEEPAGTRAEAGGGAELPATETRKSSASTTSPALSSKATASSIRPSAASAFAARRVLSASCTFPGVWTHRSTPRRASDARKVHSPTT